MFDVIDWSQVVPTNGSMQLVVLIVTLSNEVLSVCLPTAIQVMQEHDYSEDDLWYVAPDSHCLLSSMRYQLHCITQSNGHGLLATLRYSATYLNVHLVDKLTLHY